MKNLFLIFILVCLSLSAYSRSSNLGYMEVVVDKQNGIVNTIFDLNPASIGKASQIFHKTLGRNFWKSGNFKCKWKNIRTLVLSSDQIKISAESYCPDIKSDLTLRLDFLSKKNPNFKIMGRSLSDGIESTFVADKFHRQILVSTNAEKSFGSLVYLGSRQWLGLDHIVFILALVFMGGGLFHTLKIISGFTIGHTLSLVLATLGLMSVPVSIIGPLIALSIIYAATERLVLKNNINKILIATFCGVIHGFAFSETLEGLKLSAGKFAQSLLGFNLGIDLGQVIIISLFFPFIYLVRKYSNYHTQLSRFTALSVIIVGSYWFIERSFL